MIFTILASGKQNAVEHEKKNMHLFASYSPFTQRGALRTLGKRFGILERNFRILNTI